MNFTKCYLFIRRNRVIDESPFPKIVINEDGSISEFEALGNVIIMF